MAIIYTDTDILEVLNKSCPSLVQSGLGNLLKTIQEDITTLKNDVSLLKDQ